MAVPQGVRIVSLLLASFTALAAAPRAHAAGEARVDGQVVLRATRLPAVRATVELDRDPADGHPEATTTTDGFGFFALTGVAPGDYTLRVRFPGTTPHEEAVTLSAGGRKAGLIVLDAVDATITFDLLFQIQCVDTQARLVGATVTADYWAPNADKAGLPTASFNANANALGVATLGAMSDGFYRFVVTAPGWQPLTYPEDGSQVRLSQGQLGVVELVPIPSDLTVTVTGYDPVKDQDAQPLGGIIVTLTGVDPGDASVTLVPAHSLLSGEDGTVKFPHLAPITWKLTIGRLGYEPFEELVVTDATGAFAPYAAQLQLAPTEVKAVLDSPYVTDALVGAEVHLHGILDTNTAHIDRMVPAVLGETASSAVATFEHLLPGKYLLEVAAHKTIANLPANSGILIGPTSFELRFEPKSVGVEVEHGLSETVDLALEPVPATIRGHLYATDEVANIRTDYVSDKNRVFRSLAQSGIQFIEQKSVDLLPADRDTVTVDTDAAGQFTATILPGRYGIAIPSMTDYSGHNIEIGDRQKGEAPVAQPWPYPELWPYQNFEDAHHGAWVHFDSGADIELDLFVHAHYVNLRGYVTGKGEPTSALVLMAKPDGSSMIMTGVQPLFDATPHGHATVTGLAGELPLEELGVGNPTGRFVAERLLPGAHTITASHPLYEPASADLTIAAWTAPGVLPPVDPGDPSYFFPGISHDNYPPLELDWADKGTITVRKWLWEDTDPSDLENYQYVKVGEDPPQYFRAPQMGDQQLYAFNASAGSVPPGSYTIYARHGDGWFTGQGSGTSSFDAYEGGPQENTPNVPPGFPTSYAIVVEALNAADRRQTIPNVTVRFSDNTTLPASPGVAQTQTGTFQVLAANEPTGKWNYQSSESELLSMTPPKLKVTVLMTRAMVVSGVVTGKDYSGTSAPVANAKVVVRNRYGNPIAQGEANGAGGYSFGNLAPQAVYVCLDEPGFLPMRKRFPSGSTDAPDISANLELAPVPQPTVDAAKVTLDRHGLFLPGVVKSGDASGISPDNARERLTLSWGVEASPASVTVDLPGFERDDGSRLPDEHVVVSDAIESVWLVDQRSFAAPFVNDAEQTSAGTVAAPNPLSYASVAALLESITRGQKDGKPYLVVHQESRTRDPANANRFVGKLALPDLPSGVFEPLAIVITRRGAVKVVTYTTPAGTKKLQGLRLAPWAATVLEMVGTLANVPKVEIGKMTPEGKFKPKQGVELQARIDETNGYLNYKYVLAVDWKEGMTTPGTGRSRGATA